MLKIYIFILLYLKYSISICFIPSTDEGFFCRNVYTIHEMRLDILFLFLIWSYLLEIIFKWIRFGVLVRLKKLLEIFVWGKFFPATETVLKMFILKWPFNISEKLEETLIVTSFLRHGTSFTSFTYFNICAQTWYSESISTLSNFHKPNLVKRKKFHKLSYLRLIFGELSFEFI